MYFEFFFIFENIIHVYNNCKYTAIFSLQFLFSPNTPLLDFIFFGIIHQVLSVLLTLGIGV